MGVRPAWTPASPGHTACDRLEGVLGSVFCGQDTGLRVGGSRGPRSLTAPCGEPESREQSGSRGEWAGTSSIFHAPEHLPVGVLGGTVALPSRGHGPAREEAMLGSRAFTGEWVVAEGEGGGPVDCHQAPASSGHTALEKVRKGRGSAHLRG